MAAGWTEPLLAAVVLWVLVAVACAPMLAVGRLRAPLAGWPTGRLAVNYVLVTAVVVASHAGVFLGGVVVTGGFGGAALVQWTLAVAGGYPLGLWLLVGLVASATGRWSSADGGRERWLPLGIAALWYAVVAAVAAGIVFITLFALYFPG